MTVVLDAWAVVAHLRGEPAAERVAREVEGHDVVVSWINLGEALYQETRRVGRDRAEGSVLRLAATLRAEEPDAALVIAAARWKAGGRLSYADAFAAATAERHGAALLTGDPELLELDGRGVAVIDVR